MRLLGFKYLSTTRKCHTHLTRFAGCLGYIPCDCESSVSHSTHREKCSGRPAVQSDVCGVLFMATRGRTTQNHRNSFVWTFARPSAVLVLS